MTNSTTINVVIDISHHNGTPDFTDVKARGIEGVIHKGTQGISMVDPMYATNKQKAADAGLMWGAYCFGTGSDGVMQAEFFLNKVQPDLQTLVALDFEANPHGASMTLEEARAFVTHVYDALGRFPVFYGGFFLKQLLGSNEDPVLKNCPLWLSQYGPKPIVPHNWRTWTMWQYTDGAAGPQPHTVSGIGRCDRDIFNGSLQDLQTLWQSAGAAAPLVIYRLTMPFMSGEKVSAIQQALKAAGFDPGPVDGQFGPLTRNAVVSFQSSRGMTTDGEVGPETASALNIQL
jgi:lysozyme